MYSYTYSCVFIASTPVLEYELFEYSSVLYSSPLVSNASQKAYPEGPRGSVELILYISLVYYY